MSFLGDLIARADLGFQRVRDEFNTLRGQTMLMQFGPPASPRVGQRYYDTSLCIEMYYRGGGFGWQPLGVGNVDMVAMTNIVQSGTALTIDGQTATNTRLVLCVAQTDPKQNGVWKVNAGAWTRVPGYDNAISGGVKIYVRYGTTYGRTVWENLAGLTPGAEDQTWLQVEGHSSVTLHRCKVTQSATQSLPNSSTTIVVWDTEVEDTSNMWSPGALANQIVIPEDGTYLIIGKASTSQTTNVMHSLIIAGGVSKQLTRAPATSFDPNVHTGVELMHLNAGDNVTLRIFHNGGTGLGTSTGQYAPELTVMRVPESMVVQTRPVTAHAALWQVVTGTVCAHNTNTKILFDSVLDDTDGMLDVAADKITINTAGVYELKGVISFGAPSSGSAAGFVQARMTLNGVETWVKREATTPGAVGHYSCTVVSEPVNLSEGDVIELYGQHTTGAGITRTTVPSSTAHFTTFSAIQLSDTVF